MKCTTHNTNDCNLLFIYSPTDLLPICFECKSELNISDEEIISIDQDEAVSLDLQSCDIDSEKTASFSSVLMKLKKLKSLELDLSYTKIEFDEL